MVRQFSAESCEMDRDNRNTVNFMNMFAEYATDAYNEHSHDEAKDYSSGFEKLCKFAIRDNDVDFIVFENDKDGHPVVKLDEDLKDISSYRYYFSEEKSHDVEEHLIKTLGHEGKRYYGMVHPPLFCLFEFHEME